MPLLSALAAALLLAGCASTHGLAPQGRPLDPDRLASERSVGAAAASDAAFPRQDWWTALGDPQLDALIREALAGTPGLDAADARLRQAVAQAGLADAARKPSVTGGAQYSGLRLPETVAPEPLGGRYSGVAMLSLSLKYHFDLWGGDRARWQAALGQARAAEVDAQAARLTLSAGVARTYVALAQAYEARDVATAERDRAARLLELGRQRVRAGLDNELQIRQAESALAGAEQQVQAADHEIEVARTALAALLGRGPDRGLDIARPALLKAPTPQVPAVLPSELLGHRPDVVAARWRVQAAQHGIAASKAAFYPSVNLSAIAGLVAGAGSLGDLFGRDAALLQGGPALSLPIFDGGRLRSQLAGSDADYDLAVAAYNQALVDALREVVDALAAARSLDAQIASATQARDAAQRAWDIAATRYRAGLGTQLDVLAAQRPLLEADRQLTALRAQRLAASIDLDRALGGGLVLSAPDTDSASDLAKAPTP
ncbi:NodT family efflux transporter outer membrane factor (OMF) lipoprotein [Vulcaniibacterium tengchongense]|uniref:NodT family efflux transporter outer membrane factor (OMF) lipoprotein n=2 Tax=Vulcaniibacterium tengchongense TaxID=1273429 RepID=A0A3N4VI10_9GAMM|nr:NodT family efflux transporter outer membrane factor (OMF) lipoprotein [Vulcaniibacterium tengchongense]